MMIWVRSLASFSGLMIWCSLAATALIGPLAWELPFAAGAPPKKKILPQGTIIPINEMIECVW